MFKPSVAAVLVASCCFSVLAEENIEHISVYASRHAQPIDQALSTVTVLTREDIVERQAGDLPSLLNQLPGINIARNGGRGQSSGLHIRGGNTGHTLVLIDGVRTGSATLGQPSLSMIPLELIEKIEIVRGPRAAWYGSDAVAGVIAITTRKARQSELTIGGGSYGQANADIAVSHQVNSELSVSATAGYSRADGFNVSENSDPDADGYSQQYLKLAAAYQSAVGLWQLQTNINSGEYEFDSAFSSEDEADTLQRSHQLSWQYAHGIWKHQAELSRTLDSDATYGPDSRSPIRTERDEFNYQLTADIAAGLTWLTGVNWYDEEVSKPEPNYTQSRRINQGLFTGLNYQLNQWLFEVAGRHDNITAYGSQNTYQVAAGYQFSESWLLRASRGSAFKAPSFNALYWPGYANPDLKPEESVSNEVALQHNFGAGKAQLVWFDRKITNLIQGIQQAENILLAEIKGVEFSADIALGDFAHSFAYTWLDTEDKATGSRLQHRPENTINWRSSYHADALSVFVTADYQSRTYQGADWLSGAPYPEAPGIILWGIGGSFQFSPKLQFRAKVDNLFDKNYYTIREYRTAGTTFGLSLSYIL